MYTLVRLVLSAAILGGAVCRYREETDISTHVTKDGSTDILVKNQTWLKGAPPFFYVSGQKCSSSDGSLETLGHSARRGWDMYGQWEATVIHYLAGRVRIDASIKYYVNVSMVIFEQLFLDGANGTNAGGPDYVLSGFPRFWVGRQTTGLKLGYLNYGGMFVGDTTKWMDRWTFLTYNIRDGVAGGPLSLFDKKGNTLIISPFNNFMIAGSHHESVMGGVLSYGIMGSVNTVPEKYSLQTVLYFGQEGINRAFEGWGDVLRKQYGRNADYVKSDLAVNYLGYWTDNGAYYYYQTENNKTYDETIFDVQKYAKAQGIPYRYVQYDSWWYYMGPLGGVTKWEGRPETFPRGMEYVYKKTGWPVVAHNRWWSAESPYTKQFKFLTEVFKAVPMDIKFWDWLFTISKRWGLITYEQDWMDAQFMGLTGLQNNVDNGRTWLMLMGESAARNNLTLQYCMSFSRHVLQALEIPTVTQIRVSDDYSPGENDWKIAVSSIFAHAMRIAPYKDSFWTTTNQPGNPYGRSEPHPGLHALASVLSTGPVGPADAIGKTNVSLLMRCCNKEGLILKPDRPVTAIDDQIIGAAFRDGSGAPGEVWSTYSTVSGWTFGIIMAAAMTRKQSYDVTPSSAGFRNKFPLSKIFVDNPKYPSKAVEFDDLHPLNLSGCTTDNFCLHHTTPVLHLGGTELLLYGEISKWVPMSAKRVTLIKTSPSDITVTLTGSSNESVYFWFSFGGHVTRVTCILSNHGFSILSVVNKRCTPLA